MKIIILCLTCLLVVAVIAAVLAAARLLGAEADHKRQKEIDAAVITAVAYIDQVYVHRAKAAQSFETGNKKEALSMAVKCTLSLLSRGARRYLHRKRTEDDVTGYLVALIEKTVDKKNKETN